MIATMAMNMPGQDETHRTTLIVVPAALLYQVYSCFSDGSTYLNYVVFAVEGGTGVQNK
jgi:hypothetical protein